MSSLEQPTFTTRAADKVHALRLEQNKPYLNLRVYITGGGCAGFQYGFTFDEHIAEDDVVIEQRCSDQQSTVKVLIDSMSFIYLSQAEIDYIHTVQHEHFVIKNPQAKTTCGCGASFSIDESSDATNNAS